MMFDTSLRNHIMFDTSLRRMIFVRKLIFTNPECWIIINAQKSRKKCRHHSQPRYLLFRLRMGLQFMNTY